MGIKVISQCTEYLNSQNRFFTRTAQRSRFFVNVKKNLCYFYLKTTSESIKQNLKIYTTGITDFLRLRQLVLKRPYFFKGWYYFLIQLLAIAITLNTVSGGQYGKATSPVWWGAGEGCGGGATPATPRERRGRTPRRGSRRSTPQACVWAREWACASWLWTTVTSSARWRAAVVPEAAGAPEVATRSTATSGGRGVASRGNHPPADCTPASRGFSTQSRLVVLRLRPSRRQVRHTPLEMWHGSYCTPPQ